MLETIREYIQHLNNLPDFDTYYQNFVMSCEEGISKNDVNVVSNKITSIDDITAALKEVNALMEGIKS